jgi:hypothetical protein
MNTVPRREKTEQTLSVISTAYIWRSEKAIVECGKVSVKGRTLVKRSKLIVMQTGCTLRGRLIYSIF